MHWQGIAFVLCCLIGLGRVDARDETLVIFEEEVVLEEEEVFWPERPQDCLNKTLVDRMDFTGLGKSCVN